MTRPTRSTRDIDLVRVAYAHDEMEAEFLKGLLREADFSSVVRRAPGFDVPEFLAAGPRHVLVAASDVPVAQDVLREVDPGQPGPPSPSGADRRSRVLAGLMIPWLSVRSLSASPPTCSSELAFNSSNMAKDRMLHTRTCGGA